MNIFVNTRAYVCVWIYIRGTKKYITAETSDPNLKYIL